MVKKIDDHIKKAFTDLGFTEQEVKAGCWVLERGGKQIAWIALHKFLERVAQKAGIVFDMPVVLDNDKDIKGKKEIALCVQGTMRKDIDKSTYRMEKAWAIGESAGKNTMNDYPWAMAEKRAKDRVILKLLGVAGDMYSEEEADDFKKQPQEAKTGLNENSKISGHDVDGVLDIVLTEIKSAKTIDDIADIETKLESKTYAYFTKCKKPEMIETIKQAINKKATELA